MFSPESENCPLSVEELRIFFETVYCEDFVDLYEVKIPIFDETSSFYQNCIDYFNTLTEHEEYLSVASLAAFLIVVRNYDYNLSSVTHDGSSEIETMTELHATAIAAHDHELLLREARIKANIDNPAQNS